MGNLNIPSLLAGHYIQLLKIEDEKERDFYEIEAVQNNWSVRELARQYNAALYERLPLSRDKKSGERFAQKNHNKEALTLLKEKRVKLFLKAWL